MSKHVQTTEETVVDFRTGEALHTTSVRTYNFGKEPPYVKMYLDDLSLLMKIPKSQEDILKMLLQKLDYDGYITLSKRYREKICEVLKIKDQTLRNGIRSLVKSGVIEHVSTNEYHANPYLFARGEWKNIVEQRRAFSVTLKYNPDGTRQIYTEAQEEQLELDIKSNVSNG